MEANAEAKSDDKYVQLHVLHISGARADMVEMPLELLKNVVNDQMTIDVPYGTEYTLVPVEDVSFEVLAEVYRVFKLLSTPTNRVYVLQQRQDGLVSAVENMFGYNTFKRIENRQELEQTITFLKGKGARDYTPRLVRRHRLGPMGERLLGENQEKQADDCSIHSV